MNGEVVVARRDELNKLAKVNRIGRPKCDGSRDEDANRVGRGRGLDICTIQRQ